MRKITSIVILLAGLSLPASVLAKGDGVALRMEGTVSKLEFKGDRAHFILTGRFFFKQWRGPDQTESSVDVDGSRGIPVTVVQSKPFFAMTENGRGGAIRGKGALAAILRASAEHKHVVKFQLVDANLAFGRDDGFKVTHATVIRATDANLR